MLRRPPFAPTITGLVRALDRLKRVRGLGAGDLDLSGIPPAWIVALARYADQAWVTQLADLGPKRRIATLTAYTHVLAGSARACVPRELSSPKQISARISGWLAARPPSSTRPGADAGHGEHGHAGHGEHDHDRATAPDCRGPEHAWLPAPNND